MIWIPKSYLLKRLASLSHLSHLTFSSRLKALGGGLEVAERQAVVDGAHGALAMHALQNYLEDEPIYDGNAYAFSSTLLGGYLTLYAHHMTAPAQPGQKHEYHTTQLKAYALRDDEVWLEGTGAFRNLRKLAKDYRDGFIKKANVRARNLIIREEAVPVETEGVASTIEQQLDAGSSPLEFYDCQIFAEPEDKNDGQTEVAEVGLGIQHDAYGEDGGEDGDAENQDPEHTRPGNKDC